MASSVTILIGSVNSIKYSYFSEVAAQRIYDYNPNAKFICVLRNPAKRAFSAYQYFLKNKEEGADSFEDAIAKEKTNTYTTHEEKGRFHYVEHGFYAEQLQQFLQYFSIEQFFIIPFEELVKNKEGYMNQLFTFLELEPQEDLQFDTVNETGESRFDEVSKLIYKDSAVKSTLKKLLFIDNWMSLEMKTKL